VSVAGVGGVGQLEYGECLVEVVHGLRLDFGRGRLGVEALAQGHGRRYLRCTNGAQLGVEPIWEQRQGQEVSPAV
jgi:hypothetical protein